MLNLLARTAMLAVMFVIMMATGYSFSVVETATGGSLLDTMMNSADAAARLAEMTAEQKSVHLRATLVNDTVYPLAYGGLFAGLIWRFAGSLRRWFVVPPVAVIVVDLVENLVQAMALAGNDSLLALKDVLTPAKFGLFLLAAILVLFSLGSALFRRGRSPASS